MADTRNYSIINRTAAEISLACTDTSVEDVVLAKYIDAEGKPVASVGKQEVTSFQRRVLVPASAPSVGKSLFMVGGRAAPAGGLGYVVLSEADMQKLRGEASYKAAFAAEFIRVDRTDEAPGAYEAR